MQLINSNFINKAKRIKKIIDKLLIVFAIFSFITMLIVYNTKINKALSFFIY